MIVVGVLAGWIVISLTTALVFGCYARSLRVAIPAGWPQPSAVPGPVDLDGVWFPRASRELSPRRRSIPA
jgi:hypothetical protein